MGFQGCGCDAGVPVDRIGRDTEHWCLSIDLSVIQSSKKTAGGSFVTADSHQWFVGDLVLKCSYLREDLGQAH